MPTSAMQLVTERFDEQIVDDSLPSILSQGLLYPIFQPIVSLKDAAIHAHEALIRGPRGCALHMPDALLKAAARESLSYEFEVACIEATLQSWSRQEVRGRLFINVSASVLTRMLESNDHMKLAQRLAQSEICRRTLVLEITEHERIADMDHFSDIIARVRAAGMSIALDDFGDGHSSLRLWSQIKPEIVKIDKYFTRSISAHGDKLKTIQALQEIANLFGSELVAEGIETQDDLRVLRDLGITYGQGYLLGRPNERPAIETLAPAAKTLAEKQIAVFPEHTRASQFSQLRPFSIINAPTITAETNNDQVAAIFYANPNLHALALVDGERPMALINRNLFMNEYTKQYYREVSGKKSCCNHANFAPRVIERDYNVDQLMGILTSQDQRYLSDGFIAAENGRYVGLGTGDQLVRCVTETRIEAARHANPLTFLPGNIPITQHIERLIAKQIPFAACYADLNNFKPFNDHYGYWRGDEMIRLVAQAAMEQCDPQRDFLGHVGGDDFIMLFQSPDWRQRCNRLVSDFASRALHLYDEEARTNGGIQGEDRYGATRFFPCTTLSIGAVTIQQSRYSGAEEIANLAAQAKHAAKLAKVGLFVQSNASKALPA